MPAWRLLRLIVRLWPLWVIPPVLAVYLANYFTRSMPQVYSTSAVCSVGMLKTKPRVSFSEDSRPDYFRIRAAVDIVQSHLKQRETVARAVLDLLAEDLEKQAEALKDTAGKRQAAKVTSPLVAYVRDNALVTMEGPKLIALANACRMWNPGKVVELNAPDSMDDDILALLEDPRFPLSLNAVSRQLVTRREAETDLVQIEMKGPDRALIYRFLNQLLNNFVIESEKERHDTASSTLAFLNDNVDNARKALSSAEQVLRDFDAKHGISNYYEQAKYLADQRERMFLLREEHRKKAEGLSKALKELETILGGNPREAQTSGPASGAHPEHMLAKRKELARRQAELDLNANLGSIDERTLAAEKSNLEGMRSELSQEMDAFWNSHFTMLGAERKDVLVTYYKMLVEQETETRMAEVADKQLQQFAQEMNAFAPLGAELRQLEREVELRSGEYLDLQREANKSRMAYQIGSSAAMVEIQQRPSFPVRPDPSKRKYLVAAAGTVPGLAGLLVVLGLAFMNPKLRTPVNAARQLGVPISGGLPRLKRSTLARARSGAGVKELSPSLIRMLMNVASSVAGSKSGGHVLILPMWLGSSAAPTIALLESAVKELWQSNQAGEPPVIVAGADPLMNPPVYAGFSQYSKIVILWPMDATPGFLEQQVIEESRKAAPDSEICAVLCELDREGYKEFFGESMPLFAGRF